VILTVYAGVGPGGSPSSARVQIRRCIGDRVAAVDITHDAPTRRPGPQTRRTTASGGFGVGDRELSPFLCSWAWQNCSHTLWVLPTEPCYTTLYQNGVTRVFTRSLGAVIAETAVLLWDVGCWMLAVSLTAGAGEVGPTQARRFLAALLGPSRDAGPAMRRRCVQGGGVRSDLGAWRGRGPVMAGHWWAGWLGCFGCLTHCLGGRGREGKNKLGWLFGWLVFWLTGVLADWCFG
jgi:hypothetical protein